MESGALAVERGYTGLGRVGGEGAVEEEMTFPGRVSVEKGERLTFGIAL